MENPPLEPAGVTFNVHPMEIAVITTRTLVVSFSIAILNYNESWCDSGCTDIGDCCDNYEDTCVY